MVGLWVVIVPSRSTATELGLGVYTRLAAERVGMTTAPTHRRAGSRSVDVLRPPAPP